MPSLAIGPSRHLKYSTCQTKPWFRADTLCDPSLLGMTLCRRQKESPTAVQLTFPLAFLFLALSSCYPIAQHCDRGKLHDEGAHHDILDLHSHEEKLSAASGTGHLLLTVMQMVHAQERYRPAHHDRWKVGSVKGYTALPLRWFHSPQHTTRP